MFDAGFVMYYRQNKFEQRSVEDNRSVYWEIMCVCTSLSLGEADLKRLGRKVGICILEGFKHILRKFILCSVRKLLGFMYNRSII